jgi:hypothetical protein
MQKLCNMRIMQDYVMHYEKVDCIFSPANKVKEFSNSYLGSQVASYYASIHLVTEARWKELLEACSTC